MSDNCCLHLSAQQLTTTSRMNSKFSSGSSGQSLNYAAKFLARLYHFENSIKMRLP